MVSKADKGTVNALNTQLEVTRETHMSLVINLSNGRLSLRINV
jgi:hypothetical protein